MFDKVGELFTAQGVNPAIANDWADKYMYTLDRYHINTPARISAFFANVFVESAKFTRLRESFNYSWSRFLQIHGRKNAVQAYRANKGDSWFKSQPKEIWFDIAYANIIGNGSPESRDGSRYRGRGPIQLTGRANYSRLQQVTGLNCLADPEILTRPEGGSISSCYYWSSSNINVYADRGDFDGCRDLVNLGRKTSRKGDALGYNEAHKYYQSMLYWFKKNT